MLSNKDYANMPQEELEATAKTMKSNKVFMAGFIGFLIGVAVYSAVNKGGIVTFIILFFTFLFARKITQDQKQIEAEISRRKGVDSATAVNDAASTDPQ
jgi:uncharacterized membrane protein